LGLREFLALEHVSVRSPGGEFSDGVDAALLKAGERRDVLVAADDFESAAVIVSESNLAAVIPQIVTRSLREELRVLTPPLRLPPIALMLASMRNAADDPLVAWVRQEILAAGRRVSRGATA
jgi:DNA-binding transcriptional LysR family regulator